MGVTSTRAKKHAPRDPATAFVRSLDGDYYMLREAAEVLDVSDRTLRNLLQGKVGDNPKGLGPSFKVNFGKITIYLYTREDIEKIRVFLAKRRQVLPNDGTYRSAKGRPAKWTADQRKARARLYSASHYYRRRSEELDSVGRKKEAKAARAKVKELREALEHV